MATLWLEPSGAQPRPVRLFRALTTVGCSPDTDVQVLDSGLEPTHAQIRKTPEGFTITGMLRDMTVNGRRAKQVSLSDRDVIRIADLTFTFFAQDEDVPRPEPTAKPTAGDPAGLTREVVSAYRRLHDFSMRLMDDAPTQRLVELLLDGVIELTGAEKGFLLLIEDERPVVRCARNLSTESLAGTVDERLSDSILSRVRQTKTALVVDDASSDAEWSASQSVVRLELHSVLCVPLLDQGEVKGLLYVGNDSVTHVFDETALDVATVFAAQASLLLGQRRRFEELARAKQALEKELDVLREGAIVGACDSMKDVYRRVRKVATTDISVLITGETGTGKELVAREVHSASRRSSGPFVVINCGAIPEALLESELFGHVRGAFTGAIADKQGRFQAAHGGTLFLDEIGEMPLILQVKLLRALQERVVTPVGSTEDHAVDIRVVAATHRHLEDEVRVGRFREDLYYRLDVVSVHLPPLRERGEDLELLARYFLSREAQVSNRRFRGFSKACLIAMRKYRWPGNVRELENRVKKAVVLSESSMITADDLDIRSEDLEDVLSLAEAKERFQRRYIQRILERNGGNRTRTAKELGVDPRTVFRHLEKLSDPLPDEDGELGLGADDDRTRL
ncbi:MAG: sigma 54-interacting transcriptional regulator [Myxococcota bacterium]